MLALTQIEKSKLQAAYDRAIAEGLEVYEPVPGHRVYGVSSVNSRTCYTVTVVGPGRI